MLYPDFGLFQPSNNYSNDYTGLNSIQRIESQKKQYMYYIGDKDELSVYLDNAMSKMYSRDSIDTMRKVYYNITKKVINQLTVVYKQPAKRYIRYNGKIDKRLTDLYNALLPSNVNKADKRALRLAKLHNTAMPMFEYDPITNRFKQSTYSSWLLNVGADDNDTLTWVAYDRAMNDGINKVIYTDNEIKAVDSNGNEMPINNMKTTKNPYGVLPFIIFRIEDYEDFWGEGLSLLVEANENLNFLLTKLVRDDVVMGTAGILFGTNLGELKNSSVDGNNNTVLGGKGTILNVETGHLPNSVPPSLSYVNTNAQIREVIYSIDWLIKATALEHGLNPNSFSVENKVESGFSRLVGRSEQTEVRYEDLEPCNEYEKKRFDLIRKMYNNLVLNPDYDLPYTELIPYEAELMVDFPEVDFPSTTTDLWHDRIMKAKHGVERPSDWLRDDRPDLTVEEAEEIVKKNTEDYQQFFGSFGKNEPRNVNTEKVEDDTQINISNK